MQKLIPVMCLNWKENPIQIIDRQLTIKMSTKRCVENKCAYNIFSSDTISRCFLKSRIWSRICFDKN